MAGKLDALVAFLDSIPATRVISKGGVRREPWWIKLRIDIGHRLAWNVVQELGYVLNYLSLEERLPTTFKPVSPPPYMNGGPKQFLSWIIEADNAKVEPGEIRRWLEGRMPRPVNDLEQWDEDDNDGDDESGEDVAPPSPRARMRGAPKARSTRATPNAKPARAATRRKR